MEITILLILIGMGNYFNNIFLWNKRGKAIGDIECKLLNKIRFVTQEGIAFLVAWVIAVLIGIYMIIKNPSAYSNYNYVILLILVITEFPKWKIAVGKNGIVYKLKYIEWQMIISCEILERKRIKCILIKWIDKNERKEIIIYNQKINNALSFIGNNINKAQDKNIL